jgi:Fe-S-cluster containining protein
MFVIPSDPVSREFYSARAGIFQDQTATLAEVPCACPRLDASGRCSTYADRPIACRTFKVGSPMCLAAIHRRRPSMAATILALI